MSVPNTDTFTMIDVQTEIGSGDDLVELFSLAGGLFDPLYVGDKTNLLNFRNYNDDLPFNVPAFSFISHTSFPTLFPDTATGMYISVDGLHAYGSEGTSLDGTFNEYSLSTAFDTSTMVFVGTKAAGVQDLGKSMSMSPDGVFIYAYTSFSGDVYRATLSVPFLLSSAGTFGNLFEVTNFNHSPDYGIQWNADGTKVYFKGAFGIGEYNAGTPWDPSTLAYSGNEFLTFFNQVSDHKGTWIRSD
jgi:hypothetical protein